MQTAISFDVLPGFYAEHKEQLIDTAAIIAESDGYTLALTNYAGAPAIVVYKDGMEIAVASPTGCEGIDDVAHEMCVKYLIGIDEPNDTRIYDPYSYGYLDEVAARCRMEINLDEKDADFVDAVYEVCGERQDEVRKAFMRLMDDLLDGEEYDNITDGFVDDLVDIVLCEMSRNGYPVWYPVVLDGPVDTTLDPYYYDG